MSKNAIVIGAGFAGISAATGLADQDFEVTVLEKHDSPGGRARKFEAAGFTFDMGPSWYWMPDIFESYFNHFGKTVSDYYNLKRLDPSYRIFYGKNDICDLPAGTDKMYDLFESIEPGAGGRLREFLSEAGYKYNVGMKDFVYKPGLSFLEYADVRLMKAAMRLHMFTSFDRHARKYFSHPRLLQMLEFPILFLGGTGKKTPALYSLMNYGDIKLGTWYPEGGMYKVVEGMVKLAEEKGVQFIYNANVERLEVENDRVTGVISRDKTYRADYVVGAADYHHVEQELLPPESRKYSPKYWDSRLMSPSTLLWYVGVDKKLPALEHHNLLFDEAFSPHARSIYDEPGWPKKPSAYVCMTSKYDPTVAPTGHENLFVLIPVAPGLEDTKEIRAHYFDLIIRRLETLSGESIRPHIVFNRSYAHSDFGHDYNAYKGNAYGLANTLMQTAFLKPSLNNSKVKNLFYAGQLTVPGPGVPPAIISGQITARLIHERENRNYERAI